MRKPAVKVGSRRASWVSRRIFQAGYAFLAHTHHGAGDQAAAQANQIIEFVPPQQHSFHGTRLQTQDYNRRAAALICALLPLSPLRDDLLQRLLAAMRQHK